jgi:broad specificity phosphatase PhoE
MSEKFHVPIIKHLADQDDLLQNRDAGLVPEQEHLADQLANEIYEHAISNNFKVLVFCVSSKRRAMETAELVEKSLERKSVKLRIVVDIDTNLREIDQGKFILPEDYKPGDTFEGLKIAGKIFGAESFNPEDPTKDNLDYRFGDPFLQADGSYKYPELQKYFSEPGESYKDVLLRFYSQIIKLSENLERFTDKVEPVIFTHGQPHQIFTDLAEVAEKICNEGFTFEEGSLPRFCWNIYKARRKGVVPFGQIIFVSAEHVCRPEMIELLKREIAYLKESPADDLVLER